MTGASDIKNSASESWYPGNNDFAHHAVLEDTNADEKTENADHLKGWYKIGKSLIFKPHKDPQYKMGQRDGESFVLGLWKPRKYSGERIGCGKGRKTFVVYVYREDLTIDGLMTCKEAEKATDALKDLDGYGGVAYEKEKHFFKALYHGTHEGRWTILPRVVLNGINFYSEKKVWEWNLYDHRENEAFKGTLNTDNAAGKSSLYGTMTSMPRLSSSLRIAIDFANAGRMVVVNTVKSPLNFRLARFVECIPGRSPFPSPRRQKTTFPKTRPPTP